MLYIERIIESTPYGMSAPIKVVADDGKVYIVKFRKDNLAGKDRSITSEYISYKLIEHFGFSIAPQKLALIMIDDIAMELAKSADISKESLGFFLDSEGTNIAISYLDNCEKAPKESITNKKFINEVRTLDNIVMNDDRTDENTNILKDLHYHDRQYAIDWGQALESAMVYSDIKKGSISSMLMKYHNDNIVRRPGYIFSAFRSFASFDHKDIEAIIADILQSMPDEWETHSCDSIVADIIRARVQSKTVFTSPKRR